MACILIDLVILLLFTTITVSDASYYEKKLVNDLLFKDYKTDMRPVLNDNETITVTIGLSLSQIIDVVWYNEYLKWNKSDYGNITSINVKSSKVWLPDLVLYNNADESIDFRGNLDRLSTRVQLFHDGRNKWMAPAMLRSKCKINVEYFPFDSQNCTLKFGSWTYDILRLDVQKENDSIGLEKYVKSGEWYIAETPVKRHVQKYFCCPEAYPDVTFHIIIRRRSLFYLTNLILPLVVISALIVFVFTLPPQSGERISLSITLLLSMMVFMLLVTQSIPATSEVVPLVSKFYMAVMLEMALALVTTCYVIRCYHSTTSKVPRWLRELVVKRLANLFGVKKSTALMKQEQEKHRLENVGDEEQGFIAKMMKNSVVKQLEDVENGVSNCMLDVPDNHRLTPNEKRLSFLAQGNTGDSVGTKMLGNLEIISSHILEKESEEIVQEQWLVIATVVDRVAMWIFALVLVATVIGIFYQAPGYVS